MPAFHACVFEEVDGTRIRLLGCATNTFVSDEFMRSRRFLPPFFWIGPELTKQVMSGKSPLLSDTQVQDANSISGLNIVVWPSRLLPDEQKRTEVNQAVMTSFMEHHQGYLLKELMVQATNAEEVQIMMNMGPRMKSLRSPTTSALHATWRSKEWARGSAPFSLISDRSLGCGPASRN